MAKKKKMKERFDWTKDNFFVNQNLRNRVLEVSSPSNPHTSTATIRKSPDPARQGEPNVVQGRLVPRSKFSSTTIEKFPPPPKAKI